MSTAQAEPEMMLARGFERLHPVAMGVSFGLFFALVLGGATAVLALKGGEAVGPHLGLLSNYAPGYHVDAHGVLLGAAYGLGAAFVLGRGLAWREILGRDLLHCRRLSRIYYNWSFFFYPLQPINKGTYERRHKTSLSGPLALRDQKIEWCKDLGRFLGYLESHPDLDTAKLAYELCPAQSRSQGNARLARPLSWPCYCHALTSRVNAPGRVEPYSLRNRLIQQRPPSVSAESKLGDMVRQELGDNEDFMDLDSTLRHRDVSRRRKRR